MLERLTQFAQLALKAAVRKLKIIVSEAYNLFYELIYSTVVSYGSNFINVLNLFNIEASFRREQNFKHT
jgi:hypothetical protein